MFVLGLRWCFVLVLWLPFVLVSVAISGLGLLLAESLSFEDLGLASVCLFAGLLCDIFSVGSFDVRGCFCLFCSVLFTPGDVAWGFSWLSFLVVGFWSFEIAIGIF